MRLHVAADGVPDRRRALKRPLQPRRVAVEDLNQTVVEEEADAVAHSADSVFLPPPCGEETERGAVLAGGDRLRAFDHEAEARVFLDQADGEEERERVVVERGVFAKRPEREMGGDVALPFANGREPGLERGIRGHVLDAEIGELAGVIAEEGELLERVVERAEVLGEVGERLQDRSEKVELEVAAVVGSDWKGASLNCVSWSVEVESDMASCGRDPSRIAIESGEADLDGVFDEAEPRVDVSRRGGDPPVLRNQRAGEFFAEAQPQMVGDGFDPARERIVRRAGIGGEDRWRSPRRLLVASERDEEIAQRIVIDRFAGDGAREERDELPEVEIDAALEGGGEVAVEAEGDAGVDEEEGAGEVRSDVNVWRGLLQLLRGLDSGWCRRKRDGEVLFSCPRLALLGGVAQRLSARGVWLGGALREVALGLYVVLVLPVRGWLRRAFRLTQIEAALFGGRMRGLRFVFVSLRSVLRSCMRRGVCLGRRHRPFFVGRRRLRRRDPRRDPSDQRLLE